MLCLFRLCLQESHFVLLMAACAHDACDASEWRRLARSFRLAEVQEPGQCEIQAGSILVLSG